MQFEKIKQRDLVVFMWFCLPIVETVIAVISAGYNVLKIAVMCEKLKIHNYYSLLIVSANFGPCLIILRACQLIRLQHM